MSLTAPTTRRGAIAAIAGAAVALTGLGAGTAIGQQRTAHLAPAAAEITASVRCPLDMRLRIETAQYVANLHVTQDRRPTDQYTLTRPVHAGLSIRRKGAGLLATESTNPDMRLPVQVGFHTAAAHLPGLMGMAHESQLAPAHVAEIQAMGDSLLRQIRALAPQLCGSDTTDRTIAIPADDQRLQPLVAGIERLYQRSKPPTRISLQ